MDLIYFLKHINVILYALFLRFPTDPRNKSKYWKKKFMPRFCCNFFFCKKTWPRFVRPVENQSLPSNSSVELEHYFSASLTLTLSYIIPNLNSIFIPSTKPPVKFTLLFINIRINQVQLCGRSVYHSITWNRNLSNDIFGWLINPHQKFFIDIFIHSIYSWKDFSKRKKLFNLV